MGADGVDTLLRSLYVAAPRDQQVRDKGDGEGVVHRLAYTYVGSRQVMLTEQFAWQPTDGAAAVLVHEALHSAGLGEWPEDPNGLSSRQITRLVGQSCGFRGFDSSSPG